LLRLKPSRNNQEKNVNSVSDAKTGHYHFDRDAIQYLEEYLGVFIGYLSGPLAVAVQRAESERM
jgi:hypothetical protein